MSRPPCAWVAAGRAVGVARLRSLAEAAESNADWWLAARYFSVLQTVIKDTEGVASAVDSSYRAVEMIEKLLSTGNSMIHMDEVDEVLLQQLGFLVTSTGATLNLCDDLRQRIKASETRKRYPAEAHAVLFGDVLPEMFAGRMVAASSKLYELLAALVQASRTHADSATRYKALQVTYNYTYWWGLLPKAQNFDWDSLCGERGSIVIQAALEYDFDRCKSRH